MDGSWVPEEPTGSLELELSVLPSNPWGGKGTWKSNQSQMVNDLINHIYVMKSLKYQKDGVSGNFQVSEPKCF